MTRGAHVGIGCVVLSQGNRPAELDRTLRAVLSQEDVALDVVVVGNGWQPVGLPDGVRSIALVDNVGVPAGRNIGAEHVTGAVLLFLDDDVVVCDGDLFTRVATAFDGDARLGVVQPRSVDTGGARTATRHVPRIGGRGPTRSGDVAWFWEGCSFIRRTAFDDAGRWPGEFFYGHEGIELAWRVVDLGYRIRYAADLEVLNPPAEPFRGPGHRRLDGRNRVWVARRNLPAPLAVAYVLVWLAATLVRAGGARRAALAGFAEGLRRPCGSRRPIRWRTCVRLARLGRPPVL